MPDPSVSPRVEPAPVAARWPILGSVRWRLTLVVMVVFGLTLTVAGVLFVNRVEASLVTKITEADRAELERVSGLFRNGEPVPAVLAPLPNRPNAQVQAVGPDGRVVAATPGLSGQGPLVPARPPVRPPPRANGEAPGPNPIAPPGAGPTPNGPAGQVPGRPMRPQDAVTSSSLQPQPQDQAQDQPRAKPAGKPEVQANSGAQPAVAPSTQRPGVAPGNDYTMTRVPVSTDDGEVNLVALSPLADVKASIEALSHFLWVGVPVLVLLIGISAWILAGRALRPVAAMTQQVDDITASTLHERVPVPASDDEIAHLARTMNRMLERLEQGSARQRQFVSNASHELRSPVASIRTEMEVALCHPEYVEWDEVARNVLAEDERLERIVTDLLTLARLDEQGAIAKPSDVDLEEVVVAEAARTRRLPVTTTSLEPARLTGRPDELGRMVGHLLDNATRHGINRVEIAVTTDAGRWVHLRVDDDGPGVPTDQRTAVFERFGRLQEGRSRDSGGAGLGLSVVRCIAQRHGGSVVVTDSPIGGARFEVTFPMAKLGT